MRLILLACVLALGGCGKERATLAGDPKAGQLLLRQYGCGTCHHIPGVAAARGNVGPPLDRLAKRVYLAGTLPNTPDNLAAWIRHPQKFEARTAMPDMQVSESHARDMVAYLYTLK
jgi:cytochrome c2